MKKLIKFLGVLAFILPFSAMAAQNSIVIPNTGTLSGLSLVNKTNDAFVTLNTGWSGSSAPSTPATGQTWLDTSTAGIIAAKRYDGSQWIVQSTIDTTNHVLFNPIGGGVASLASASTTDIGSKTEAIINVTGTTTISSLGTSLPTGQTKVLVFSGSLTLTYNATSLILPSGASITTAAGDTAIVTSLGSGNYRVVSYSRASGSPIGTAAIANGGTGSTTASGARTNLDVYSKAETDALVPTFTDWTAYTPTFTGFGTVTVQAFRYMRIGKTLRIQGKFTSGTSTATEARISLPSGFTSSSTLITSVSLAGNFAYGSAQVATGTVLTESGVSYMTFGVQNSTLAGLTKQNGNNLTSSGTIVSLFAEIPVQ